MMPANSGRRGESDRAADLRFNLQVSSGGILFSISTTTTGVSSHPSSTVSLGLADHPASSASTLLASGEGSLQPLTSPSHSTASVCDLDYDPFKLMVDKKLKYGFTISIFEYAETIATLWDTTKEFIKANPQHLAKDNLMSWVSDDNGETYNRCVSRRVNKGSLEFCS